MPGEARKEKEPAKDYILLPLWTVDPPVDEDLRRENEDQDQEKHDSVNNTNKVNVMDVKSALLYEKIEEEVYVCQPSGFEDPDFPDKIYKVEKALYGLHQAPRVWEVQIHAKVNGKSIIIIESSVRRDLKLTDEDGKDFSGRVTPLFPKMMVQNQGQMGEGSTQPTDSQHTPTFDMPHPQPKKNQKPRKPKRKTTKVPQPSRSTDIAADEAIHKEGVTVCRSGSDNISKTQTKETPNEPSFPGSSSGGGPRLKHIELMKIYTTLQKRVLNLEDELKWTKTAQQTKIDGLERRVKKLENKQRSRTHKLKRLYKVGLTARVIESSSDEETILDKVDASRQMMIDEIDADEDIGLISTHEDVNAQDEVNVDEGFENVVEEEVVEVITTAKIIVEVATASTPVIAAATTITTAQPTEATKTSVEITTAPKDKSKDKGKAKMIKKPEMPKKRKGKSQQKQEANEALINTWDDIQARIDADAHLAQQLQEQEQNELTDAEKAKLFMEFMEKRRKFFAAKKAKEKRNKPPTKAQ
nr:ribonuclease H-like domain-containing protein [Tanacetum cinerariifolium]